MKCKKIIDNVGWVILMLVMAWMIAITGTTASAEEISPNSYSEENGGWFETVPINIFGENVAPGTSGEHEFSVRNTSDYELKYELVFYGDNAEIPLRYRIRNGEEYLLGDENTWLDATTIENAKRSYGAVEVKGKLDLVIEWEWPYESGNDELDTAVGINGLDVTYYISLFGTGRDANRAPQVVRSDYVEVIPPRGIPFLIILLGVSAKFVYNKKQKKGESLEK